MTARHTPAEQMFWSEIGDQQSTRRSLSICLAFLMAQNHNSPPDLWFCVNRALIARFRMKSETDLRRFYAQSRARYDAAAVQICPVLSPEPQHAFGNGAC